MQKTATRIFIVASVTFGILGVLVALTMSSGSDNNRSELNELLFRMLFADGFVVLSSFALSVAGKYLNGKS